MISVKDQRAVFAGHICRRFELAGMGAYDMNIIITYKQ